MNIRWKIAQFCELWWWKFYLANKDKKTYLSWKKDYWKSVFEKIKPSVKIELQANILELGCGPAGCFIFFNQNKITALDPLLHLYERELHFFNEKDYANTSFISVSIEEATIDETFDFVLCFNAINHVKSVQLSLNKISKCLSPKGKLLLSVDAHNHLFLKKIFAAIPGDVLHPHQYTLQEYTEMCDAVELNLEQTILLKREKIFSHHLLVLSKTH